MTLRPATADDARLLHEWANDPETRAQSFTTDPIPWDGHVAWFGRVLADPDRCLWLLENYGQSVGSIRFDAENGRALVSVQIAPQARGQGLGKRIVGEASALYRSATGRVLDAEIKPGNAASIRAFEAAGYQRQADREDGSRHYTLG